MYVMKPKGSRGRWNCETWHCEKGISGTKMQGWKLRDMNQREKQSMVSHWRLNT